MRTGGYGAGLTSNFWSHRDSCWQLWISVPPSSSSSFCYFQAIHLRCSWYQRKGNQTKRSVAFTLQRPAASPTSESWEWCHHAARTAIPTLSGVFTAKAIVVYLLMDRQSYFISRDGDDSGHICFYLISQPPITAIYHGPCRCYVHQMEEAKKELFTFFCDLN